DSAGRLLGYGRSEQPVDVAQGSSTDVSVLLRRPFSYLVGGASVIALDPTFDITQTYKRDVNGAGAADAVAVPPDGKDVVVVEGTMVRLIDTATHAPVAGVAPMSVA